MLKSIRAETAHFTCELFAGENGFLFDAGDIQALGGPLAAVSVDSPFQHRAETRARRNVEEKFNWSTVGSEAEEVYQRTIRERRT